MGRRRSSPQREMIYDYVRCSTQHPTAEVIFEALRSRLPALSRGTVYRNLSMLAEEGLISRMSFNVERYDGNVRPHPHLICEKCGCVQDLQAEYDSELDTQISQSCGCRVLRHECYFYGHCSDCLTP